jgi:hypothetical protein
MTHIPENMRRYVRDRAHGNCEYCLLNERYSLKRHEIDHVRASKHGGETAAYNLCLSCFDCNRHKGSDLSSIDPDSDDVVTLFHPRRERWSDHFQLDPDGTIEGKTATGRATVNLLDFNHPERVTIRSALMRLRRYPESVDT